MAITATINAAIAANKMAFGKYLDSAGSPADAAIDLGFVPSYIKFVNLTDRISYEYFEGMTDDHALKIAVDGTATHETSNGFTLQDIPDPAGTGTSTGTNSPGAVDSPMGFTFGTITQNKQYYWVAFG